MAVNDECVWFSPRPGGAQKPRAARVTQGHGLGFDRSNSLTPYTVRLNSFLVHELQQVGHFYVSKVFSPLMADK